MTEKVLIEINRLKNELDGYSAREALDYIESYINTLSKQQVEEPVPADLEEAADEYEKKHTYQRYDGGGLTPEYNATLAEAFIAGYNLCKEQMLKDAVEGEVCIPNVWVEHKEGKELVVRAEISKELGFKFGDKVRIIIVKED